MKRLLVLGAALAHGAEVVSYFRWRQFPQAQEQFHAGLNRPDFEPDVAYFEAQQVATELETLSLPQTQLAAVALVFDYEADWLYKTQPQGKEFSYRDLTWMFYQALRSLGLDVDFIKPGGDLEGYKLAVVPSTPILHDRTLVALGSSQTQIVLGPRTGSKTESLSIPPNLPPGKLQTHLPLKVTRVESLRTGVTSKVAWGGQVYETTLWKEWIESTIAPVGRFEDGKGAVWQQNNLHYLAFWPSLSFLQAYLGQLANSLGIQTFMLPENLRLRRRGDLVFAFNYADHPQAAPAPRGAEFVLGGPIIEAYNLSIWKQG